MSSISSFEGIEKDSPTSIRQKSNNISEGLQNNNSNNSMTRYASLRKTDLLDVLETTTARSRDTDTWSVAATIDDQESVISSQGGGLVGLSSSSQSTIITTTTSNEDIHRLLHEDNGSIGLSTYMETLHDLDDRISTVTGDDEDKRSRSIAAEFGDDGTRSATADFDDSEVDEDEDDEDEEDEDDDDHHHEEKEEKKNDDQDNDSNINDSNNDNNDKKNKNHHNNHHKNEKSKNKDHDHSSDKHHHHRRQQHNVVNDFISAPPQPQPSFAPVIKSYMELLEENDLLQTQIHKLRITQKHQDRVIDNLRRLTECSKENYDEAIRLSTIPPLMIDNNQVPSSSILESDQQQQISKLPQPQIQQIQHNHESIMNVITPVITTTTTPSSLSSTGKTTSEPYVHYITDMLKSLTDNIDRFVQEIVDEQWQLVLKKELFKAITEKYLLTLPFGTDNQDLLNTAYRDQLRRFQATLGASFAKWYRRQTVQSLSLNPATKEYFEKMKDDLANQLSDILLEKHNMTKSDQPPIVDDILWNNVLHWSRYLALELHGGEADVFAQPIAEGTLYDQEIMLVIGQDNKNVEKFLNREVTFVASPLFIDEDDHVLYPASVLLEDA